MKTFIYLIIIFRTIKPEVLMGFEAESRVLRTINSVSNTLEDAYIKTDMWSLFTDKGNEDSYEMEVATKGGLTKKSIITVKNQIYKMFQHFEKHVKNFTDLLLKNISIVQFLEKLRSLFIALDICDKRLMDIDDFIQEVCDSEMEDVTDEDLAELNFSTDVFINIFECYQTVFELDDLMPSPNYDIQTSLTYYKKTVDMFNNPEKYIANFVKDIYDQLKQDLKEPFRDNYNDVIYFFDKFIQYQGRISKKFTKGSKIGDSKLNNDIVIYCEFNKHVDLFTGLQCPSKSSLLYIQLTYQLELESLPAIFNYYAKFYEDESKWLLKINYHKFIPDLLKRVSSCILYADDACNGDDFNQKAAKRWKDTYTDLNTLMDMETEFNTRDANGLFYLVLEYAITVFRRPDSEEELTGLAEYLHYGPKRLAPIMSRISFSEMFDNMNGYSKNQFITLISIFCYYDFRNNKAYTIKSPTNHYNNCKDFRLPDYYNIPVEGKSTERINPDLNVHQWLNSVIGVGERSVNQPKYTVSENETEFEENEFNNDINEFDLLSPPPGFRYSDDPSQGSTSDYVYSFGGLKRVRRDHIIVELRPYTSTPISVEELDDFIEKHAFGLYDYIRNWNFEQLKNKPVHNILSI